MAFYPPYLGAGVRIRRISADMSRFDVEMKLHFWNCNVYGTHFGGSLYSMCDPFFVLILTEQLGRGYAVWDKAATIRFRRPGRGRVRASFSIAPDEVDRVRALAAAGDKVEPVYSTVVLDEQDEVVAEVEKLLSVRAIGTASPS